MSKQTKTKTLYVCDNCGQEYLQWQGKCDQCQEWNSLKQIHQAAWSNEVAGTATQTSTIKHQSLNKIVVGESARFSSGISELDRVLGGGITQGSLVLISGEPGVGKSTLLLQVAALLARQQKTVLYVSGEESEQQVKARADRLDAVAANIIITAQNDVMALVSIAQQITPDVMIIDSIQTLNHSDYPSSPGSIVQLRECGLVLQHIAKRYGVTIFVVGHVTKQGTIAGPKVLEHMVDTVLTFDARSDRAYRLLRAEKNRFGDTTEVGVFTMTEKGFESIADPSSYFLAERSVAPGSALTMVMEGRRPIVLEVQALANKTVFGYPKRTAAGFDNNRLQLLLAILERHAKLPLNTFDVYVNSIGGLKINEPAADLAVCAAIVSSVKGVILPEKLCLFGEVGLTGEVRKVVQYEQRVKSAERLHYQILPYQASLVAVLCHLKLLN